MQIRPLGGHGFRRRQRKIRAEGEKLLLPAQSQVMPLSRAVPKQEKFCLRRLLLRGSGGFSLLPQVIEPKAAQDHKKDRKDPEDPPFGADGPGGTFRRSGQRCRLGRAGDGLLLRRGGQLCNRDAEFPAECQQIFHIRRSLAGFPFADGLTADAQPRAQFLLRDPQGFSVLADGLA